jgi:hypothetical protein
MESESEGEGRKVGKRKEILPLLRFSFEGNKFCISGIFLRQKYKKYEINTKILLVVFTSKHFC